MTPALDPDNQAAAVQLITNARLSYAQTAIQPMRKRGDLAGVPVPRTGNDAADLAAALSAAVAMWPFDVTWDVIASAALEPPGTPASTGADPAGWTTGATQLISLNAPQLIGSFASMEAAA